MSLSVWSMGGKQHVDGTYNIYLVDQSSSYIRNAIQFF